MATAEEIQTQLRNSYPGEILTTIVSDLVADNARLVKVHDIQGKEVEQLGLLDSRINQYLAYTAINPLSSITTHGVVLPSLALNDPRYVPNRHPDAHDLDAIVSWRHYYTNNTLVKVQHMLSTGNLVQQTVRPWLEPGSSGIVSLFAEDLAQLSEALPTTYTPGALDMALDHISEL